PPGRRSNAQHGTAPTWNEGHAALASRQVALRMNRVQSAGQPVVASPGPPSLAAIIGGTVVFGSNASTLKQTMTDMKAAEAHRTELISRMDLRVVGDEKFES